MTVANQTSGTPDGRYYVTHDGRVRGPFDLGLIEAMVMSGNFSPNIPVCKVGSQQWSPLSLTIQTFPFVPDLTTKRPSQSSKSGGRKRGLVIVGVLAILSAVGALIGNLPKSGTQQNSGRSALPSTSTPTPPQITPAYTPTPAPLYRDGSGTYRVPQWANPGLVAKKSALDAQKASLDSLKSQVDALDNQIESERPFVDRTNQYAVDEFNREVHRYNTLTQQLKDASDAFQTSVNDYNAELARVGTPIN